MKPAVISSRPLYQGKVFDVLEADIDDNGVRYKREIVTHHGSCVVIPVFNDGTVALVRQYRHAAGKYLLEIPAGTLNRDEPPEAGAARELEEEVGVIAGKLEKISEFYVSPGFLTEKMFLYLAENLSEGTQNLEEDELLSVERYTFPQAFDLIRDGSIEDAKTIIGLMLAGPRFGFMFETHS